MNEQDTGASCGPGSRKPSPQEGLGPTGFDPSRVEWHGPTELPGGNPPVLAEYHEWDDPRRPLRYQVVWRWDGDWRPYPSTGDRAYVRRWSYLTCDSDGSPEGGDAKQGSTRSATARAAEGGIAQPSTGEPSHDQ